MTPVSDVEWIAAYLGIEQAWWSETSVTKYCDWWKSFELEGVLHSYIHRHGKTPLIGCDW